MTTGSRLMLAIAVGTTGGTVTASCASSLYTITVTVQGSTSGSVVYRGQTIGFTNATATKVNEGTDDEEVIITFTDTTAAGSLVVPAEATASVLVVGGGSGGVAAKSSTRNKYNGNGGNGGQAELKESVTLPSGDYTITVGAGGAGATVGTKDFTGGGAGGNSSITGPAGFTAITKNGGAAWTSQDDDGSGTKDTSGKQASSGSSANVTTDIAGNGNYEYGKGGIPPPSASVAAEFQGANADEYGEGGQGSANGRASGAGYQGIVIVRISGIVPLRDTPKGIWITDHADAGAGKVHLAFTLTSDLCPGETLTAKYVRDLASAGRIKVACGTDEAALEAAIANGTAELYATTLRDSTAQLGLENNWVWVTVTLPDPMPTDPLLYKIVITE